METVSLANGVTLTVNGNGHTITLSNGAFFQFPSNANTASEAGSLAFGDATTQAITVQSGSRSTGGAIFGDNTGQAGASIPIQGTATFLNNVAAGSENGVGGGAVGFPNLSGGTLRIGSPGSTVFFTTNSAAVSNGGAIGAVNAGLTISGNATFSNNTAAAGNGGAIYDAGAGGANVTIGDSSRSNVTFTKNTAAQGGGAVFAQNNNVIVNGNVTLSENRALGGRGGAIDEESNSVTVGSAGSTVSITKNTAESDGGAIWSQNNGVTINGANITLEQNTANGSGGTVFDGNGLVLIGDASGATVNIIGNTAGSNGGAVYANNGSVTVNGNVTLMNNIATSGSGGAIFETNNAVQISNNGGNVSITGNTAGSDGGAIYEGEGGTVTIGNSAANVGITGNMAGSSGGGIYSQNGLVTITGVGITIEGNGATTGNGGAVYAGNGFTLNANGPAVISSNAAGGLGGAIYLNGGNLNLNAMGGNITFSGNTENGGTPNAIYFNAGSATFNTAAGQRISFFDPIESNPNKIVSITKTGPGTVSFDGSQRQNVSNIFAQTTVQEGTFEVANGAVYGVNAPNTSFTVNSGAILQGGIAGTVATNQFMLPSGATLNIAGNAPAGSPFSVFTIDARTAAFEQGSEILFNTELNDASVQHTDLLVLSHAVADAPGTLVVRNFGGQGGDTGDRDGIRLVQAINGATTTPSNFTLPAGELRAGAFDYGLFRGGLNPSNFPNDWFLRSDFVSGGGGGGGVAVAVAVLVAVAAAPCLCRSRHSPLTRRRIRCRPEFSSQSLGRSSLPMGWCNLWRGNWGSASSARSTTGSATLTSRMVAPLRLRPLPPQPRLLRLICRPRSRRQCRPRSPGLCPARCSRPQSGGASSAKRFTTTIKPSPIPAPTAIWEASRAGSIFCTDL